MHSEKTDDAKTAGLYDLISNGINDARSLLLDVSEAVQMWKFSPAPASMAECDDVAGNEAGYGWPSFFSGE
jgi:hypothetical protein